MNCQNIQDQMSNFLRSKLPTSELDEISTHLASCTTCRFVYQEVRQQIDNSGSSESN